MKTDSRQTGRVPSRETLLGTSKQRLLKGTLRVFVKRSHLPGAGKGLFAKVDFKKGDRIRTKAALIAMGGILPRRL